EASSAIGFAVGPGLVGRHGWNPLGADGTGSGSLSPPSVALSPNSSAPGMTTLTPLAMTPSNSSQPLSTSQSTAPCPMTQTGIPTASGVPTTFGAPLTGLALSLQATTGCR